jgi:hypothetical protein
MGCHILIKQSGIEFQNSQKGFLRNFNIPYLPHPFLSLLLFFKQFSFSGNVASITLCGNILTNSFHCFPRDDLSPDGCLNSYFILLARDILLQFFTELSSELVGIVPGEQG